MGCAVLAFDAILGQRESIEALRRIARSGSLGHAYLFAGPRGVGKATVARTWLTGLLCERGPGDPCGECGACRRAAAGHHPDLHVLEPEGAGRMIRIDAVRTLCHQLAFPPLEGRHKAALLDDAHRLNAAAANALLKTLEEPTPQTTFVLVTDRLHALPATIRSRCQLVRFHAVPRGDIETILRGRGVSPEAASIAAGLAAGSVGRALELAQGDVASERAQWLARLQRIGSLGAVDRGVAAEEMAASVDKMERVLELLRAWYRDVLVVQCAGPLDSLVNSDCLDALRQTAARMGTSRILASIEAVEGVLGDMRFHVNRRLAAEVLLARLARLDASAPQGGSLGTSSS